ncbi:hypothetical protein BpHYR1_030512 [Brachionus plicatilis]|uniref:Uncharacterized protein n=1 Tax=Brachionus plicatilis TaxID=10195 RepID=A0A3M7QGV2_BRAPC|nr:hypothetical protein BpHYR1_030512 [Brachionus plicatilis]
MIGVLDCLKIDFRSRFLKAIFIYKINTFYLKQLILCDLKHNLAFFNFFKTLLSNYYVTLFVVY